MNSLDDKDKKVPDENDQPDNNISNKENNFDPCYNCVEKMTGVGGESCLDCQYKK
jgi:hypothetical protein